MKITPGVMMNKIRNQISKQGKYHRMYYGPSWYLIYVKSTIAGLIAGTMAVLFIKLICVC